MKRLIPVGCAAAALGVMLSRCVQVVYQKQVTVHKDAAGTITETVVSESISEPHSQGARVKSAKHMEFHYLK
jgi:hypothetical protein